MSSDGTERRECQHKETCTNPAMVLASWHDSEGTRHEMAVCFTHGDELLHGPRGCMTEWLPRSDRYVDTDTDRHQSPDSGVKETEGGR